MEVAALGRRSKEASHPRNYYEGAITIAVEVSAMSQFSLVMMTSVWVLAVVLGEGAGCPTGPNRLMSNRYHDITDIVKIIESKDLY